MQNNQLVIINDFLLCNAVVRCADGPVLTVDLFLRWDALRRCYTKARREMQSGILASLTPRFTLVMLLSAVHAQFAAQSLRAVRNCGVTCVIFLEQDGSYIPSREHQRKKKKRSRRQKVKIAVN